MIKFSDRKGTQLNQKILEVNQVVRDEAGEIVRLNVKEIRDDASGLTKIGTPLNANSLNSVLESLLQDAIMQDNERVNKDLDALVLNKTASSNFTLKTKGEKGSDIRWEVVSGTGITISGANAIVTRELYEQIVTIKATITFNNISQEKTFSITVITKELTESEKIDFDLNGLIISTNVSCNFALPQRGSYGSSFLWKVTSGTGITISGANAIVTRELYDQNVTLQVTAIYNTTAKTKIFNIKIPKKEPTASDRVDNDLNELSINTNVSSDFTLPQSGSYGSSFSWKVTSGNGITISDNIATVVKDYVDQNVTLQVTATYSTTSKTKNFYITIPGKDIELQLIPSNFDVSWTQEIGAPKSATFYISSLKEIPALHLEVEADNLLDVKINRNESLDLSFTIRESNNLNQTKNESSKTISLSFIAKVYFAQGYDRLIRTIQGKVSYTYQKVVVSD